MGHRSKLKARQETAKQIRFQSDLLTQKLANGELTLEKLEQQIHGLDLHVEVQRQLSRGQSVKSNNTFGTNCTESTHAASVDLSQYQKSQIRRDSSRGHSKNLVSVPPEVMAANTMEGNIMPRQVTF